MASAAAAAPRWANTSASERAAMLERGGGLLEQSMELLCALLIREAGRTMPNAVSEVREAVDYCRYCGSGSKRAVRTAYAAWPSGLHQPLEFPARDLHRADRGGARGRKPGAGETGGADAPDRGGGRPAASSGRHSP